MPSDPSVPEPVGEAGESQALARPWLAYGLSVPLVIAAGLFWRSRFLHLPPFLEKYGGDALWALLVFLGFGLLFRRASTFKLALVAIGFSWAVEFSQLYHAPWIDAVRSTRLGGLVLGATFNWPDLVAYMLGIGVGVLAEMGLRRGLQAKGS